MSDVGGSGGLELCPQPHCPEVLYGDRPAPRRGMEVDETDIYWGEASSEEGNMIRAAPKDGSGPVRTLGRWYDFSTSQSLVVDDQHAYWLLPEETGWLHRVKKDGSEPWNVALPADDIGRRLQLGPLHDAGDAILVATHGCEEIMRVSKEDGELETWEVSPFGNRGGVTGIESYGSLVYCSNNIYLHRLDTQSGEAIPLLADFENGGPLMLLSDQLYILGNRSAAGASGTLGKVDLGVEPLGVMDLGATYGQGLRLLHDQARNTLYWATGITSSYGHVVSYDVNSEAPPQILFEGQDVFGGSAMDDDYLYWVSNTAITRLKKW